MKKTLFTLLLSTILFSFLILKSKEPSHTKLDKKKDVFFTLIITAHNAENVCEKILQSVLGQTCQDFRIIFIDDGSEDQTYRIAKNMLKDTKATIIHFDENKGSLERAYEAIQLCNNDEIVILLDPLSYFANNQVMEKFKQIYSQNDVWLAYSQEQNVQTMKEGSCKYVNSKNLFSSSMRKKAWQSCHLKSFYAHLFKKVKLSDFFFRGKFVDPSMDMAYMFPMLEMAKDRIYFIPDICCNYYPDDKIDVFRSSSKVKWQAERYIRRTPNYEALTSLEEENQQNNPLADLLIFSFDRPMQLFALLESINKHINGINKICVIYRCSHQRYEDAYVDVRSHFRDVEFIEQSNKPFNDFKPLVMQTTFGNASAAEYILFAVDDLIITDKINMQECIESLEKANAYFFSLRLGKLVKYCYMGHFPQKIPHHIQLPNQVIGWQLDAAQGDWFYPNSLDMTLYRKKDIHEIFQKISFIHPNELEIAWCSYKLPSFETKRRVGLSFEHSKAINIPLNIVNQSQNTHMNLFTPHMLLEKYEQGLKINITPLFQKENISVHMEYEPEFIQR